MPRLFIKTRKTSENPLSTVTIWDKNEIRRVRPKGKEITIVQANNDSYSFYFEDALVMEEVNRALQASIWDEFYNDSFVDIEAIAQAARK